MPRATEAKRIDDRHFLNLVFLKTTFEIIGFSKKWNEDIKQWFLGLPGARVRRLSRSFSASPP